jgi:Phosphopantetheine attachment site
MARPLGRSGGRREVVTKTRVSLTEVAYVAPADELERQVADVLASVLDVDRVGRLDTLYDLGGSSIDAIRICARIERDLGHLAEPVWLLDQDELHGFVDRFRAVDG